MLSAEDVRPAQAAEALAALPAEDFDAIVAASLGRDALTAVWDALTDPAVISRTRAALAALNSDAEHQLALANASLDISGGGGKQAYFDAKAERAEWRRKALGFRRLVQQRLAFVNSRITRPPNQPPGSGTARRRYAGALEALARAVAAHRDKVLSGEGGEDDDDALWDCLDRITVSDGNGGDKPLAEWLAFLDEVREDGE
jgi:hypothetical protein